MPVERETIITESGGGGASIIGGIIFAVVLVLLGLWFFGAFDGAGNSIDAPAVNVEVPPVEITPPAQ